MNNKEALFEVLVSELGDYGSFTYSTDGEDNDTRFDVTVKFDSGKISYLEFKVEYNYPLDQKVYIEQYEGHWEHIETFEWTIKYFWMALLKWP